MLRIILIILTITGFPSFRSTFQAKELPPPPQIMVSEDQFISGTRGRLCLNDGNHCENFAPPETEVFSLFPGAPITLQYSEPYPDLVVLRLYEQPQSPRFSTAIIPEDQQVEWLVEEAGTFRLRIMSFWDDIGFAEDYFHITIPEMTVIRPPQLFLLVDEERNEGELTGFCWAGFCGDGQPSVERFVSLGGNNTLHLQFEPPYPGNVYLELYADLFDLITGRADAVATADLVLPGGNFEWTTDVPDGYYVLSVFAQWESTGTASYFFGVVIY